MLCFSCCVNYLRNIVCNYDVSFFVLVVLCWIVWLALLFKWVVNVCIKVINSLTNAVVHYCVIAFAFYIVCFFCVVCRLYVGTLLGCVLCCTFLIELLFNVFQYGNCCVQCVDLITYQISYQFVNRCLGTCLLFISLLLTSNCWLCSLRSN